MTLAETIHCIATLDFLAAELLVSHNESVSAARQLSAKGKGLA